MNWGIDWKESSTVRGAIKVIGCIVALLFLWFKDEASAMTVFAVINAAGNSLSIVTKDK